MTLYSEYTLGSFESKRGVSKMKFIFCIFWNDLVGVFFQFGLQSRNLWTYSSYLQFIVQIYLVPLHCEMENFYYSWNYS